MSRRDYLIDGYNLLHAAGFARNRYGPGEMHRARQRLLALIAEHLDVESRERIEIIFDAHDPPADVSAETRAWNMRIRYSVETGDADAMIEDRIREHSAPRQLWVVSSDHRLIDAAKRRRAKSLTSEDFLDRLFADRISRHRPRETSASEPDETSGSTAEWLAFFGFDTGSTIDVHVETADSTLPPVSHLIDANRSDDQQISPPEIRDDDSTERAPDVPDVTKTGSLVAEAAFWQRRIDELFEDPPEDRR